MFKNYHSILVIARYNGFCIKLCPIKVENLDNVDPWYISDNSILTVNRFFLAQARAGRPVTHYELYDNSYIMFQCPASRNGIRKLLRWLFARDFYILNINVLPILSKALR